MVLARLWFTAASIHSDVDATVLERSQGVSQEVVFQPCGIFDKLTFEREAQSQGVVIKRYRTDNGVYNVSEFMEELLKKQQKCSIPCIFDTARGSSLAVSCCTTDIQVTLDRPGTP